MAAVHALTPRSWNTWQVNVKQGAPIALTGSVLIMNQNFRTHITYAQYDI